MYFNRFRLNNFLYIGTTAFIVSLLIYPILAIMFLWDVSPTLQYEKVVTTSLILQVIFILLSTYSTRGLQNDN